MPMQVRIDIMLMINTLKHTEEMSLVLDIWLKITFFKTFITPEKIIASNIHPDGYPGYNLFVFDISHQRDFP